MRETGIASNEMKHLHPKATEIFVSHAVEKENEHTLCTNEELLVCLHMETMIAMNMIQLKM